MCCRISSVLLKYITIYGLCLVVPLMHMLERGSSPVVIAGIQVNIHLTQLDTRIK